MWISWKTIRENRNAIKLISKCLPRLDHYAGIANRVSKENYVGKNDMFGGIGQRNVFSRVACRDEHCVMFSRLERKKVGILIISSYDG